MVLHPPGKCRKCGAIFPATAFAASNSLGITFRGCATSCPNCGGLADVLDGTYNFIGDTVELLSGPESTIEALKKLAQVVKTSVEAGEPPEKTMEKAIEAFPPLRKLKTLGVNAFKALTVVLAIKGMYDLGMEVSGEKQRKDEAQQVSAAHKGALTALEAYDLKNSYREMRARQQDSASESSQMHLNPMLSQFPLTAQRLAELKKSK